MRERKQIRLLASSARSIIGPGRCHHHQLCQLWLLHRCALPHPGWVTHVGGRKGAGDGPGKGTPPFGLLLDLVHELATIPDPRGGHVHLLLHGWQAKLLHQLITQTTMSNAAAITCRMFSCQFMIDLLFVTIVALLITCVCKTFFDLMTQV